MRSFLLKCVAVVSLCVGVMCFGATAAFAATLDVKPASGGDAALTIQAQLDKARTTATESNPVTVRVAAGSYKLSDSLKIYSNTTLDLTDVSLKATNGKNNMIRIGPLKTDPQTGYYCKNVTVIGGDLDNSGHAVTAVIIGHCANVKLLNMKVHNANDAHLIEVSGTDGFTADGCVIYDQLQNPKSQTSSPEALQIDILVKKHMGSYRSEALAMKNIVVNNCEFRNVPRGVGSHTAFLNGWVDNVRITNNKFTNCKSGAIQLLHYTNCLIEGNVINSAPRGIVVYTVNTKGVFFGSTAAKEGSTANGLSSSYMKPPAKQNIVIRNNTITVKGTDIYADAENEGIIVSGFDFKSALKKNSSTDAIPKGNYYASGITIAGNSIKTAGHGIRLSDVRNSTIADNSITYTSGKTRDYYGIQLTKASTNNTIKHNTIKARTNGIFVTDKSSAKLIENNRIVSCSKYGIAVDGATATTIKGNTVDKAPVNGMYIVRSSKVTTISNNTIKSVSKGSGINVDAKSTAKTIKSNTIGKVKLCGIYVHKNAKSTTITKNKITGAKKFGICVEANAKVSKITSNTIKMKKSKAIAVRSGSSKVSGNKFK